MYIRNTISRLISNFHRDLSRPIKSLMLTTSKDTPGKLKEILEVFSTFKVNLTHIESHPASTLDYSKGSTFVIDFELQSESQAEEILNELKMKDISIKEPGSREVDWFPLTYEDLDTLDQKTLAGGAELECDHPGFKDEAYKKRRHEIAQVAFSHNCSDNYVPKVQYNDVELKTWQTVFDSLTELHEKYACEEYLQAVREMKENCGFRRDNIPQIQDINEYLQPKTGFRLIPIAGLLSARDFLSYLAFRVFASTQYIRHHSVPFYTPEPDIVHELIGHAPLFANPDFADFSQQIGLASLGANDLDIKRLATCYWFSVEFGLIKNEKNEKKIYGAGVLSSASEILNAVSDQPEFRFFDPFKACDVDYPITSLQPIYFWSKNFQESKDMMNKFAATINKGFITSYDRQNKRIKTYQNIKWSSKTRDK